MRILAFNVAHDASVCSIKDGEIEFFCKEERLSRKKRDKHPFKALDKFAELNFGKVDHALYVTPSNNEPDVEIVFGAYIQKKFNVKLENYSSLKHHDCHASLAFYNSGFEKSLVFVIDRNGSMFFSNGNLIGRESESVYIASTQHDLIPIRKNFWLSSGYENSKNEVEKILRSHYHNVDISAPGPLGIVKVYEAATTLIRQNPLENGKTMGLSSYGENLDYDQLFWNNIGLNEKFIHIPGGDNVTCFYNCEVPIVKEVTESNYQPYANRAKQVQLQTQQVALNLISEYVKQTNIKNVCIVGGYGLNVVANNFYLKKLPDVNFYFEPVADDTGVSIGAAMLKYKELTYKNPKSVSNNFYHFYEDEPVVGKKCNIDDVCNLLINQKSVAIFEGNPEAGPRALGHRSILFDARNPNAKKLVNEIKKREWYRPFAGVILEEYFNEYFETLGLKTSSYMTINFDCKEQTKNFVPGIIHVDNTCRIQTVSNGFLYELLNKFYEKTNCPMLLNTSFNLAGEALVQTKKDAIHTYESSALDAICFVEKNEIFILQK
jgi:carbamoyltransferase